MIQCDECKEYFERLNKYTIHLHTGKFNYYADNTGNPELQEIITKNLCENCSKIFIEAMDKINKKLTILDYTKEKDIDNLDDEEYLNIKEDVI